MEINKIFQKAGAGSYQYGTGSAALLSKIWIFSEMLCLSDAVCIHKDTFQPKYRAENPGKFRWLHSIKKKCWILLLFRFLIAEKQQIKVATLLMFSSNKLTQNWSWLKIYLDNSQKTKKGSGAGFQSLKKNSLNFDFHGSFLLSFSVWPCFMTPIYIFSLFLLVFLPFLFLPYRIR